MTATTAPTVASPAATSVPAARAARRPVRRRPVPDMRFFRTRVSAVTDLGPHLRRVTVRSPELSDFASDGPDQRIKLLLPRPGQDEPVLPADPGPDGWYAAWRAAPADVRPILRTYTIRRARPEQSEVDIDFLQHDHAGPGSTWAAHAEVGDLLVFYGPYADYEPTPDTDWQLIAGDAAAVPAIGAILETLPGDVTARVFLDADPHEVGGLDVGTTSGRVEVTWLSRGQTLADAVRAADLPLGRPYVWIGAEADSVRQLRRHLVGERGIARGDIYFCGYWRRGRSEDDAIANPDPEID